MGRKPDGQAGGLADRRTDGQGGGAGRQAGRQTSNLVF